ncbi:MAG: hypothetical protein Ct9H300mP18_11490 [Candidatus Neomarinimicrobiota bacterium]|nr:MAG: hypothetical protein Ct9H300mP18_11490 [Candidatus Neomarinimicrobiota bacterium]
MAWAIWAVWPTFQYQQLSDSEIESLRDEGKLEQLESRSIKQGLDLKGGMYIVLEVDLPTLIENLAINKDRKFSETVNDFKINLLFHQRVIFSQYFLMLHQKKFKVITLLL